VPVHPLIASRFPLIQHLPTWPEPDDETGVRALAAYLEPHGEYRLPDVAIEERRLDGPHGPVRVRLYRPRRPSGAGLVWVHGGGFINGDLDMPEAHVVAAELAARADAVVASVEYRLATGTVHYPVPLDDVHAAWLWFAEAAAELGVDPARAQIGGASAGANLAAAATLRSRDAGEPLPAGMLLAYPAMHFPTPALEDPLAAEMRGLPRMLRFTAGDIAYITRAYLGRLSDIPADLMPGLARLQGLPPAVVVLSEYDDLRGSGELFVQQLTEAGVPVTSTVAEGMLHGHLNLPPVDELAEIGRSLDVFADALRGGAAR
jgi:acetyl esterase/lipase